MTSAYILVAAILVLGGIIAALGDNLGSKVGKAKLRLFHLRPRQTAVVLTVLTGIFISASTLGILFSFSKSLREGIFKLDDILKQLRQTKSELQQAALQKDKIEKRLREARIKQIEVQKRSREINANYNRALAKLKQTSADARRLQNDVKNLLREREQLVRQKQLLLLDMNKLQTQVKLRDEELNKRQQKIAEQDKMLSQRQERLQSLEKRFQTLEVQRQQLQADINQRDAHINELDKAIALKDNNIKLRENKLKSLENELGYLNREVQVLEQYYQNYQDLRERNIALLRGQVLAFGAVRIMNLNAITDVVDELLRQANKRALQATRPANQTPPKESIVKITKAQVDQLTEQLKDGGDYVIRIISAGNYVQGENDIRVFADVAPNKLIFKEDENIATISMESSTFTEEDIQKRLDFLLSAAQFRARREGVLGSIQVEDGRIKTLIKFIEDVSSSTEQRPDEIRLVATNDTFTVGPLKLRLIALKNGEVIFGS